MSEEDIHTEYFQSYDYLLPLSHRSVRKEEWNCLIPGIQIKFSLVDSRLRLSHKYQQLLNLDRITLK